MTTEVAAAEQQSTRPTNKNSNDEVYQYVNDQGEIVEYDMDRFVIGEAKEEKVPPPPGTNQKPIIGYRIPFQDRRADGKLQDLIIEMPETFSFGVSENHDQKTGELNGYTHPIPMWEQDGPTEVQRYITDFLEVTLLNHVKKWLIENRKSFKKGALELHNLADMAIFYRKKDEDGVRHVEDHPTWYPKLIVAKKKGFKIITSFYLMDEEGKSIIDEETKEPIRLNPLALVGKFGRSKPRIKIEGIYVGAQISIQQKLWETDFRPVETSLPRKGKVVRSTVTVSTTDNNPMTALLMSSAKAQPLPEALPPPIDGEVNAGGDISVTDQPAAGSKPAVRTVKVVTAKKK